MDILELKYQAVWNLPQYNIANSSENESYLTDTEKKVLYYINLARLNPALFASTYVKSYEGENGYSKYPDFDPKKQSLIEDLNHMRPSTILRFDKSMYDFSVCHSTNIGKLGLMSHDRKLSGCPDGYFAECISYGNLNALGIVMQLLIDPGNDGLGHRKICLSSRFTSAGVSNQPNIKTLRCTVIDFK